MPPKSGKRKAAAKSKAVNGKSTSSKTTNDNASNANAIRSLTPPDRATWPGWVEMESDPALFNVMLKDMGVRGVKVQEVYGLDNDMLAILPQPVHALIFLFRYCETNANDLETSCPKHVWYAEQVPDFACATVAMLNIVNNIPGLDMGKELRDFKSFTQDMDPHSRGDAIDGFTFVKRIHNSFATANDLLVADMHYKEKVEKERKLQATAKARATKAAKAAAQLKKNSSSKSVTPGRVSSGSRKSTSRLGIDATPTPTPKATTPQIPTSKVSVAPSRDPTPSPKRTASDAFPEQECSGVRASIESPAKKARVTTAKKREIANSDSDELSELSSIDTPPKANQSKKWDPKPTEKAATPAIKPEANGHDDPGSAPRRSGRQCKPVRRKVSPGSNFEVKVKHESKATPRRSGREPKPRKDVASAVDEEAEEEGFHFCAYLPIGGRVWKLDGMDKFPQDMGLIDTTYRQDWLTVMQPVLQARFGGDLHFSLMAVVHDPVVVEHNALCANVKALQAVEKQLASVVEDWQEMDGVDTSGDLITGVDADFNITQPDIDRATTDERVMSKIASCDGDLNKLLDLRNEVALQQTGPRAAFRDESEGTRRDNEEAMHRRHDYPGFAREWMNALAEQEMLSTLLDAE